MTKNNEQSKIINDLEIYLNNLNVTQGHKLINSFMNSFKDYLISCGRILSQVEQPGHVYNLHLQDQLIQDTDRFLLIADKLENIVPLDAKLRIRDFFRKIVERDLFQSQILKRFYDKPRGYAGDYLMFEMMYDASPLSQGIGIYFDYYVFKHSIVASVINRKEKMKRILKDILNNDFRSNSLVKILNVGCGGARDVKEFFSENTFSKHIDFTLMDQDKEGLDYAESKLRLLKKKNVKFNFIQKNALEIIGFSKSSLDESSYDVIYTLGIVDYFLDNVFSRFVKHCYDLLRPNGKLIIAACSSRNMACYIALRWLCEWNFHYRDADAIKDLIKEAINSPKVEILWEEKKQIFFVVINK